MSNHLNESTLECGPDANVENVAYVKVIDTKGNDIDLRYTPDLRASYSFQGTSQTLEVSSRGCLKVPKASGQLAVAIPSLNLATSQSIEKTKPLTGKILLSQIPTVNFKSRCPTTGIFANASMFNFFEIDTKENAQSLRVEVKAIDQKSLNKHLLYVSADGSEALHLPDFFNIQHLPEGIFTLQIDLTNVAITQTVQLNQNLCVLNILRSSPKASIVSDHEVILKLGAIGPIFEETSNSDRMICIEEIAGSKKGPLCEATENCINHRNFKPNRIFNPSHQGIYRVFSFLEDRAKNRSPLVCQTFVITDEQPILDLTWKKSDWNTSRPIMNRPEASITALIKASHSLLSKNEVGQNLECKVEYITKDNSEIKGRDFECLSGRCKGRSMEEFVPCDDQIEISLVRAWTQPSFR